MATITMEYCSKYKPYDGTVPHPGDVLAPVIFTREMVANDDSVIRENLRTWTLNGVRFTVGFIPVKRPEFDRMLSIFYAQVNAYLEDHPQYRPGRCVVGTDSHGYPILCSKENRCSTCVSKNENLPRYKNREDFLQFKSLQETIGTDNKHTPLDIADPSVNVEDEAILKVLLTELIDYLAAINPRYARIVTLGSKNYTKDQIIRKLGLKPSRGYQEISTAKKLAKAFLRV